MPRKTQDEESDLDSNAPLLPQPNTSQKEPAPPHSSTSRFSIKWWHPILAASTVVLLWTAISVSGLRSTPREGREVKEDPKWPTFPQFRGPTPTVSPL